jgi:hypothetical protein
MENITLTNVAHRVTINDEPPVLTNRSPNIKGLSRHYEDVQKRVKKETQTVFNFFQLLGLDPHIEYITYKPPKPAQPIVRASFVDPKRGRFNISFLYNESPLEGGVAYTHFNINGGNIRTFRKLYFKD